MLQDKYLPEYHFHEVHTITVSATPAKIYSVLLEFDFSGSWIIRTLVKLRGLPSVTFRGMEGLKKMGFCLLEEQADQELIFGLVGQFWKPVGNIQHIRPAEFTRPWPGFAKAAWNFEIKIKNNLEAALSTETRIVCADEATRRKFAHYWFLIRPFSGLIRKEILKLIRQKAEQA